MIRSLRRNLALEQIDWRPFLKPAVVLAVVGLSYFLGRRPSQNILLLLGAAVGGASAFLVLMARPEWGLIALMIASFNIRFELGTGTKVPLNATILILALLLGIWVLRMVMIDREVRLLPSRANTMAGLFALVTTVALLFGNINLVPQALEKATLAAQMGGWMLYVFPVGLFLLVGHQVRTVRWLQILTWSFLGLGSVYILSRLVFGLYSEFVNRAFTPNFGSVFWTWLVALAFGQFIFNTDLHLRWRAAAGLLVALTLFTTVYQTRDWISGWAPPLVAIAILLWLRSWRLGLLASIIGAAVFFIYYTQFRTQVLNPIEQYSIDSRAATWPIMLKLIEASPLFGLGPANYYHYTVIYPLLGWYVKFNSHNNYLDIIAQTGLLGLLTFGLFMLSLGLLAWRLRKQFSDGFTIAYINAALAGLVAMLASGMMGDWFLPFLYNIGFAGFRISIFGWIFLGGLAALEQIARRQKDQPEGGQEMLLEPVSNDLRESFQVNTQL